VVASPLPDRERRHLLQFYLLPKLSYIPRLGWAGILILAGLAVQLLVPSSSMPTLLICSLPLLLAGNLLLLVRGFNLKPEHMRRRGEWEKTTRDRFLRMREMENEVRRWDETATDLTCATGVISALLLAIGVAFVVIVLAASPSTRFWAPLFAVDAGVLLIPHWITGTRRGWRPVALRQQIDALEFALAGVDQFAQPACQIQPMFEMTGKGDRRMPINARVLIRFPDGPEDFYGVQIQVTLNDVQGTKYPYLYAVLVARKPLKLVDRHLAAVRKLAKTPTDSEPSFWGGILGGKKGGRLTIESSHDKDVDVIVIRQHTTKQSGYHTKPSAITRIVRTAWAAAEQVVNDA